MRGRFSIPPHFVFIVIGILIAIYINQKFDCYVLQVSAGGGAAISGSAFGGFVTQRMLRRSQTSKIRMAFWRVNQVTGATAKLKLDPPSYAQAGWPFKYYLDCQFYGSEPLKVFSVANLLLNLFCFRDAYLPLSAVRTVSRSNVGARGEGWIEDPAATYRVAGSDAAHWDCCWGFRVLETTGYPSQSG